MTDSSPPAGSSPLTTTADSTTPAAATASSPLTTAADSNTPAAAAGSSPPTVACPRLDPLPARDLPGGLRVAEAESRAARMKGLARLDAMPAEAALHIPRCRSVHTFTMRFALDLIWLDRAGHLVRIDREVPPRRLKTCVRARSVVEANAGTADAFLAAGLAEQA